MLLDLMIFFLFKKNEDRVGREEICKELGVREKTWQKICWRRKSNSSNNTGKQKINWWPRLTSSSLEAEAGKSLCVLGQPGFSSKMLPYKISINIEPHILGAFINFTLSNYQFNINWKKSKMILMSMC